MFPNTIPITSRSRCKSRAGFLYLSTMENWGQIIVVQLSCALKDLYHCRSLSLSLCQEQPCSLPAPGLLSLNASWGARSPQLRATDLEPLLRKIFYFAFSVHILQQWAVRNQGAGILMLFLYKSLRTMTIWERELRVMTRRNRFSLFFFFFLTISVIFDKFLRF